jgi:hypothetical protein
MEGWIKLHRRLLRWEWFTTPNMVHVFIYLLLSANHKEGRFRGIKIERGATCSSLSKIRTSTGLSLRSIRTCLERLKSTGEVTVYTTNKYSIITLCNYDEYNDVIKNNDKQDDKQDDTQTTNERQQTRIIEEEKEEKNAREIFLDPKKEKEIEDFNKMLLTNPDYD